MYLCIEVQRDHDGKIKGHPRLVVVLDYGEDKPKNGEDLKAILYETAIHMPSIKEIKIAQLKKPRDER